MHLSLKLILKEHTTSQKNCHYILAQILKNKAVKILISYSMSEHNEHDKVQIQDQPVMINHKDCLDEASGGVVNSAVNNQNNGRPSRRILPVEVHLSPQLHPALPIPSNEIFERCQ